MELAELFSRVLKKPVKPVSLTPAQFKKEYFNSDVILFRATSDSILGEGDVQKLQELISRHRIDTLGGVSQQPG